MATQQDDDNKWADKQDAIMDDGKDIIKGASDEALEYVADIIQNMNDRQWRKMAVETQAVEMGVGVGMAEHLVPVIYNDMRKNMRKRTKLSKEHAEAIRHIYIGRVIKNVVKELNNYERN